MESVRIVEVGPRDGLQNIKSSIATATKIELIDRLQAAGCQNIELTSIVSPKVIPQLSDSQDLLKNSQIQVLITDPELHLPVLVPNQKGLDIAIKHGVKEIAVFISTSEEFSQANIRCSVQEGIDRATSITRQALAHNILVRGYVSCIFTDPFSGPTPPSSVLHCVKSLLSAGCYEVSLGDTSGVGVPYQTRNLLTYLRHNGIPLSRVAGHFHDTYGQAVANVWTAYESGVRVFDSSISGLGGCPYAPGAKGNVATEDLVYMFDSAGVETGIDLLQLTEIGVWISNQLNKTNDSRAGCALAVKLTKSCHQSTSSSPSPSIDPESDLERDFSDQASPRSSITSLGIDVEVATATLYKLSRASAVLTDVSSLASSRSSTDSAYLERIPTTATMPSSIHSNSSTAPSTAPPSVLDSTRPPSRVSSTATTPCVTPARSIASLKYAESTTTNKTIASSTKSTRSNSQPRVHFLIQSPRITHSQTHTGVTTSRKTGEDGEEWVIPVRPKCVRRKTPAPIGMRLQTQFANNPSLLPPTTPACTPTSATELKKTNTFPLMQKRFSFASSTVAKPKKSLSRRLSSIFAITPPYSTSSPQDVDVIVDHEDDRRSLLQHHHHDDDKVRVADMATPMNRGCSKKEKFNDRMQRGGFRRGRMDVDNVDHEMAYTGMFLF